MPTLRGRYGPVLSLWGGKKYNSVVITYLDGSKITICEEYDMRDRILSYAVSTPGCKPIDILPKLNQVA